MREWLATKRLGEKRKIPRVYFFHFRTYIHFQRYEKNRCEVQEVNSAILFMRLHETNSAFDAEYCSVFGRAWLIQRDNNKRQNGLHCDERSSLVSCHPNLYWHLSCCIVILWKWSTDLVSNIRIFNFFVFFFYISFFTLRTMQLCEKSHFDGKCVGQMAFEWSECFWDVEKWFRLWFTIFAIFRMNGYILPYNCIDDNKCIVIIVHCSGSCDVFCEMCKYFFFVSNEKKKKKTVIRNRSND